MKRLLIIVGCFALLLEGCKDDDQAQNWTRYEYLNEARDYIYFKQGTWWVYKKIPGGDLDTIEVINSWIDTTKLTGGGNTMYYEHLAWRAKSTLDNYEYKFYRTYPTPLPELHSKTSTVWSQYFLERYKPGSYQGPVNIFTYPFTSEILYNGHSHDNKKLDDIDSLTIQGNLYHDLKHFEISDDVTFVFDKLGHRGGIVQYYFASGVGIVKKEHMTKGVAWELIESHIIQ